MSLFRYCLLWLCSSLAVAGQLQLSNGDVISGELTLIEKDTVSWQNDLLGDLKIKKAYIIALQTQSKVDLSADKTGCSILDWREQTAQFVCGGEQILLTVLETQTYLKPDPLLVAELSSTSIRDVSGKLRFTGSQSHGNKTQQHWDVAVSRKWQYGDYRNIVALSYESNSTDSSKGDEEYELDYQFNWFFNRQWFLYADTNGQRDDAKSIEERYSLGLGLGYQIIQTDKSSLSIELGGENAKENVENGDDKDLNSLRWQLDYDQELIGGLSFFHNHDILAVSDQGDDWEFNSNTGLSIPLGKGISAEIKTEYDYDNLPLLNNNKEDITTTIGVGYDW